MSSHRPLYIIEKWYLIYHNVRKPISCFSYCQTCSDRLSNVLQYSSTVRAKLWWKQGDM